MSGIVTEKVYACPNCAGRESLDPVCARCGAAGVLLLRTSDPAPPQPREKANQPPCAHPAWDLQPWPEGAVAQICRSCGVLR